MEEQAHGNVGLMEEDRDQGGRGEAQSELGEMTLTFPGVSQGPKRERVKRCGEDSLSPNLEAKSCSVVTRPA